jgi:hypothetical protein
VTGNSTIGDANENMEGTKFFRWSKPAANIQGEGWAYNFTVTGGYKGINGLLSLITRTSANIVDDNVGFFIYDVTNGGAPIEAPDSYLKVASFIREVNYRLQLSNNSVTFRLILHFAGTHANAGNIDFDAISYGPKEAVKGAVDAHIGTLTTSLSSSGGGAITLNATGKTEPILNCYRKGEHLQCTGLFVNGTGGAATGAAGSVLINMPSGYSINMSKIQTSGGVNSAGEGLWYNGSIQNTATIAATSATQLRIMKPSGNTYLQVSDLATNAQMQFDIKVPILGWSSNMTLSEDGGTRKIAFRAYNSVSQSIAPNASYAQVLFGSTSEDSSGSFSSSTFTAPETGNYSLSARVSISSINVLANRYFLSFIDQAGAEISRGETTQPPSATSTGFSISDNNVVLEKGQTVRVYLFGAGNNSINTLTANGGAALTSFQGHKLSSPQTLAGSETVGASYTTNAGQAITSTQTTVKYGTKKIDTHNAYNTTTGLYTAPTSGRYLVVCRMSKAATVLSVSQLFYLTITSSTGESLRSFDHGGGSQYASLPSVGEVYLARGESVGCYASTDLNFNLNTAATDNFFMIERIGN